MRIALALLLAAFTPSTAQASLVPPERFARNIYSELFGDFDFRSVRYAPELQHWIDRDVVAAGDDVGSFEADPFCDCQDTKPNYRVVSTRVVKRSAGRATVAVWVQNGPLQRFSIDLVQAGAVWLVADIHTSRRPSLLAYLRYAVPRAEAAKLTRPAS